MGSPAFGLPTLRAILNAGHDVTLVVSQPDRPAGRTRRLRPPPVAAVARELGLPLHQPERLRGESALDPLLRAAPEAIVVAAFGQLLPRAVLDLAPLGCLNVHPSLLPRWRGASPVQAALLHGDPETGVTIIRLTEQLDAGPILAQVRTSIGPDEDAPRLEARLAEIGARLVVECLEPLAAGKLRPRPQDEAEATYCRRLERADAELDWGRPALELARVVRAFRGSRDAFTFWDGRLLKVLPAEPVEAPAVDRAPGIVFEAPADRRARWPLVATGRGALLLRELALEGRAPTAGEDFLRGYPGLIGARLGRPTVHEAATAPPTGAHPERGPGTIR